MRSDRVLVTVAVDPVADLITVYEVTKRPQPAKRTDNDERHRTTSATTKTTADNANKQKKLKVIRRSVRHHTLPSLQASGWAVAADPDVAVRRHKMARAVSPYSTIERLLSKYAQSSSTTPFAPRPADQKTR